MALAVFALWVAALPIRAQARDLPSMLGNVASQIAAGYGHTCALTTVGAVQCWGSNSYGQLGNGTTVNNATPVAVTGLTSGVAAIAAGYFHTCVLTTAGGVQCWGSNSNGQLGNASTTDNATPVAVTGLTNGVAAIAAGYSHTCALTTAGGVQCWGYNSNGQLGNGSTTYSATPVTVTGLGSGVAAIATGDLYTCALTLAGGVQCWGYNSHGTLGNGSTTDSPVPVAVTGLGSGVAAIATGDGHTCALAAAGGVQCWGSNSNGQLGNGSTTDNATPVAVTGLGRGVTAIATGYFHTCALTPAGALQCWGSNGNGQLGNGSTTYSATPVAVTGLGSGVAAIVAGYSHTCALTPVGGIQCWGYNRFGQLGNNSTTDSSTPAAVVGFAAGVKRPLASEVNTKKTLVAGDSHTCALTTAGAVQCWGYNSNGQLGNGSTTGSSPVPVAVTGLGSGVAAIATSSGHTCALTTAGAVQCWGSNGNGQLGNGSTTGSATPVAVSGLGSGVAAIAAAGGHTCVLTTAGAVYCWGYNLYGQLGNGTTTDSSTPVAVPGLTGGVAAITAGYFHTCALTTAGGVLCWGSNSSGQLGNGTTTGSLTPAAVPGLTSGVAAIAAGYSYNCALTTANAVQCWGSNDSGQLGNGTTTGRLMPVAVSGLTGGVAAIAAGYSHTCALTTAGGVQCWGGNGNGELGNGSTNNSAAPITVTGLANGVAAIAVGNDYTCALTMAGGVQCWGWNSSGQLGNNSTTDRHVPIVVRGGQTLSFAPALTMAPGSSQTLSATSSVVGAPVSYATWTDDAATLGTCHLAGAALTATRTALCGVYAASNVYDDANGNDYAPAPSQFRLNHNNATTQMATTTTLSTGWSPSINGQAVELKAAVAGSSATGSVQFIDGSDTLCTVPLRVGGAESIAYCVAIFSGEGPHTLAAHYGGDSQNSPSAGNFVQTVATAGAMNINQFGLTGAWYNPVTTGQGMLVNTLPSIGPAAGTLFVGWFTYDSSGNPRWYAMQGALDGTDVRIYQSLGGNLDAPPKVGAVAIGHASIVFADCLHATVRYTFEDGTGRTGIIPITRLSPPTTCSPTGDTTDPGQDVGLSGSWYNPRTSGQGMLLTFNPDRTLLFGAWYTYAPAGELANGAASQRWFSFQSNNFSPGNREIDNVSILAGTGGVFDDPTAIATTQVGVANIRFIDCNTMQINYRFTTGELAGISNSISQMRLGATPKGCQ